jgi:hypothetical protein
MKADKILDKRTFPKWEQVAKQNYERGRMLYDAGLENVAAVINLAISGGECIRCGKPWSPVNVDNVFAKYTYYTPGCRCYPKCRKVIEIKDKGKKKYVNIGCGRVLFEEVEGGTIPGDDGDYVRCGNCKMRIKVS